MKMSELLALEPKLEAYELNPDGKYLICINQFLPRERLQMLSKMLKERLGSQGINLVAVVDFVPRIFELEDEEQSA